MASTIRRIPWVLSPDLGPYILRMGLFPDNDYAQICAEIQRILICASLRSVSPQSEHNFFQFWSGCQDVWCITNGLPTAIWQAAWVHSTHYCRSQTTSLIYRKAGYGGAVPVTSESPWSSIHFLLEGVLVLAIGKCLSLSRHCPLPGPVKVKLTFQILLLPTKTFLPYTILKFSLVWIIHTSLIIPNVLNYIGIVDGEDFPVLEEMLTQINSDSKFALIITGEYLHWPVWNYGCWH